MELVVLSSFLHDTEYNQTVIQHIKPEFFEDESHKILIECALEYSNEHKKITPKIVLETILESKLNIPDSIYQKAKVILEELYTDKSKQEIAEATIEWKLDESLRWFKERAAYNTILLSLDIIDGKVKEKGKVVDKSIIPDLMQKALNISFDTSIGHNYIDDAESRFEFMHQKVNKIPFKIPILNKITGGGVEKKSLNTIMAGTGCHVKGTPILLRNGNIKNVEDILQSDELMGDNGTAREIYNLITGHGKIYKIVIQSTGEEFEVNEDHILSLVHTEYKSIVNISIKEYLTKSNNFKRQHKSYYNKTPIEFAKTDLILEPYFMGLYLGDGHTHSIGVTTMDSEIELYVKDYMEKHYPKAALRVKEFVNNKAKTYFYSEVKCEKFGKRYNTIAKDFSKYGLNFNGTLNRTKCAEKFIPEEYMKSSIEDRLQLLAGLIDSDGHMNKNGYYDLAFSSEQIAKDIQYVARSLAMYSKLGIRVINGKSYYRVSISTSPHSTQHIPCKLPRKQTAADFVKFINPLHSAFTVEYVRDDNYYGFNISHNNLYCMGNFMVTHNTGKSLFMCSLSADYISLGYDVLYITLEMAEEKISNRIDANLLNVELDQLVNIPKSSYLRKFETFKEKKFGKLIVKEYPTATAGANNFRYLMMELESKQGFRPDVVFIDYLGIAASSRYKSDNMYQIGKSVSEEFRGLAVERNVAMWTAVQSNRGSQDSSDMGMTDISESFGINMVCDFIIGLISSEELKALGQIRFKQLKNRYGDISNFTTFLLEVARSKMRVFQNDEFTRNGNVPEVEHKKPESILPTKSRFDNLRTLN